MNRAIASAWMLCVVMTAWSCAHRPPNLVITGNVLHAAALSFEGTAAGMDAANSQGRLTGEQVRAWNAFVPKFKAGFHAACDIWRAAADAQDATMQQQAEVIIGALLAELAGFTAALMASADGGAA